MGLEMYKRGKPKSGCPFRPSFRYDSLCKSSRNMKLTKRIVLTIHFDCCDNIFLFFRRFNDLRQGNEYLEEELFI